MLEPEPLDIDPIVEPARFPVLKRVGIGVAVLLVLAVVAAFAVPPLLPESTTRSVAAGILGDLVGRPVRIGGKASLSLLPSIAIDATDITVGDAPAPGLTVRRATLDLSALALVSNHIEIHRLSLQAPRLDLTTPAASVPRAVRSGWSRYRGLRVDRLEVRDGRLSYPAPLGGGTVNVTGISLDGHTQGERELRVSGTLHAGNADGRIDIVLTEPSAFIGGAAVPLEVHFHTGSDSLSFDGMFSKRVRFAGQGRLSAAFSDPARLAAWLGNTPTALSGIGFKLDTQIDTAGAGVGFRDLDLTFGGFKLKGVLSLVGSGKDRRISGSLETPVLRLKPLLAIAFDNDHGGLLASLPQLFPANGHVELGWQHLQMDGIDGGAGQLTLGRASDGKLRVTTDDLLLAGGHARLEATVASGEGMTALTSKLRLIGVDVRKLLAGAGGAVPPVSGKATLELDLLTVGATPADLAAALTGHGAFTILDGSLSDPMLLNALKTSAKQGALPFQSFTGSFRIAHGVLESDDVLLKAENLGIIAKGKVDLAKRTVSLHLNALETVKNKRGITHRKLRKLLLEGSTGHWQVHPAK